MYRIAPCILLLKFSQIKNDYTFWKNSLVKIRLDLNNNLYLPTFLQILFISFSKISKRYINIVLNLVQKGNIQRRYSGLSERFSVESHIIKDISSLLDMNCFFDFKILKIKMWRFNKEYIHH